MICVAELAQNPEDVGVRLSIEWGSLSSGFFCCWVLEMEGGFLFYIAGARFMGRTGHAIQVCGGVGIV